MNHLKRFEKFYNKIQLTENFTTKRSKIIIRINLTEQNTRIVFVHRNKLQSNWHLQHNIYKNKSNFLTFNMLVMPATSLSLQTSLGLNFT